MKIVDLVKSIDAEDELICVADSDSADGFFSFWTSEYFDKALSEMEMYYIENLDVQGFHIERVGLNVCLEVTVQLPKVENDPEFSKTIKDIYGEELYNEMHKGV